MTVDFSLGNHCVFKGNKLYISVWKKNKLEKKNKWHFLINSSGKGGRREEKQLQYLRIKIVINTEYLHFTSWRLNH